MVNEKKVRIMTELALEEKKHQVKDLREGGFYKSDYILFHVTSAMWNITIGYFLIVVLIALYHAEYILLNVAKLAYGWISFVVLGICGLLILLCALGSYNYYSMKYLKKKKEMEEYIEKIEKLQAFYQENEEEVDDDRTMGI